MLLECARRLMLHDPPMSLRIHEGTPDLLWDVAVETTKACGGVPTFESDKVIIPTLLDRGLSLESARNYCLIGCVEPGGCGDDWPANGGPGQETFWRIPERGPPGHQQRRATPCLDLTVSLSTAPASPPATSTR